MKKKICFTLVLCLILSTMAGCGPKKPYDMTIEDLRTKINENIKALGYDTVIPEFETRIIDKIVNGEKVKPDKNVINYFCLIKSTLAITITPPYLMAGNHVTIHLNFPENASDDEINDLIKDYVAVTSGIIATIDPKADLKEIIDNLKPDAANLCDYTFNSEVYIYRSQTLESPAKNIYKVINIKEIDSIL